MGKHISARRIQAIRARLFFQQKGKCYYCKRMMLLEKGPPGAVGINPMMCTLEHIYPKGHPMRGSKSGLGNGHAGLRAACYDCNQGLGNAWGAGISARAALKQEVAR